MSIRFGNKIRLTLQLHGLRCLWIPIDYCDSVDIVRRNIPANPKFWRNHTKPTAGDRTIVALTGFVIRL